MDEAAGHGLRLRLVHAFSWEHYERLSRPSSRSATSTTSAATTGDTVNRYKVSKQADVLMPGYLFYPAELRQLFERLGCGLGDETWPGPVDYYLRRTSHGSTLNGLVHGQSAWCRRTGP